MNPNSIVNRNTSVKFSRLDEAYLAIDAPAGFCYSLNATAGRVWELLSEPLRFSEICAQMSAQYAVSPQTCENEIASLLGAMQNSGLISLQAE